MAMIITVHSNHHVIQWFCYKRFKALSTPFIADDIRPWCEKHITLPKIKMIGRCRVEPNGGSAHWTDILLHFKSDEDALMFKMKWL
jgi:hypothetical protein